MSELDQLMSAGAQALPVWIAGGLAALLFCVGVLAFKRAALPGRIGNAWRAALLVVGAGLMWVVADNVGGRDQTGSRRVLDARGAELTLRAIAPGSPLACLEAVSNPTVEASCEKLLFASAETVAAAVAYVDARLMLLADSLELAARDRSYAMSIERLRRAIEADRFGVVAHVLATRGCTADKCPTFKLLRDPGRVVANLRDRSFDAHVVLNAQNWHLPSIPQTASVPPASAPAMAAAPASAATTGAAPAPSGRFEFPSSASIPAISIMNAEPPLPPPAAEGEGASPPPARPAPRRQTAREPQAPPQQAAPQLPPPLPPPGTLSNPR